MAEIDDLDAGAHFYHTAWQDILRDGALWADDGIVTDRDRPEYPGKSADFETEKAAFAACFPIAPTLVAPLTESFQASTIAPTSPAKVAPS